MLTVGKIRVKKVYFFFLLLNVRLLTHFEFMESSFTISENYSIPYFLDLIQFISIVDPGEGEHILKNVR